MTTGRSFGRSFAKELFVILHEILRFVMKICPIGCYFSDFFNANMATIQHQLEKFERLVCYDAVNASNYPHFFIICYNWNAELLSVSKASNKARLSKAPPTLTNKAPGGRDDPTLRPLSHPAGRADVP